jgi:hypothetical protein
MAAMAIGANGAQNAVHVQAEVISLIDQERGVQLIYQVVDDGWRGVVHALGAGSKLLEHGQGCRLTAASHRRCER